MKIEQLQLQRRAFRNEVRFVAGGQQRFAGQLAIVEQMADLPGVEHRFDLVDVAVEHRQARAFVVAQLFDDLFDRVVEVDAVDIAAWHQNVVDRDVVQRVDPGNRVGARRVFRVVVRVGRFFVFALLHHLGLAGEGTQQQTADAAQ